MLSIRKPSPETIHQFLKAQGKLKFTYPATGATAATPPSDYVLDHTRVKIGEGEHDFQIARKALKNWQQFNLGWLEASPSDTPIQANNVIAVVARAFGLWWLNACRIVYVIEEDGPIARFGFAYGTLPDHIGKGEERFLIEWDKKENQVWYDILAFSRPQLLLARLGYPLVRRRQKRFGRESAATMRRIVELAREGHPQ